MSSVLRISWRSCVRNKRRSIITALAVGSGTFGLLMFGGFFGYLFRSVETSVVQGVGHFSLHRTGYFMFGAGNTSAYGIDNYREVLRSLESDAELSKMVSVLSATQSVVGIASFSSTSGSASKTFAGVGLIPSDRDRMGLWDPYKTGAVRAADTRLSDAGTDVGITGMGLGRLLGICERFPEASCPRLAPRAAQDSGATDPAIMSIAQSDAESMGAGSSEDGRPTISLLAATADGAPNVLNMRVGGLEDFGAKEADESTVMMNLQLAQQLVYGRGPPMVDSVVVQLKQTSDMERARTRLSELIKEKNWDLEIIDLEQMVPTYRQIVVLFNMIFFFLAIIMGLVVMFAVVNTMTMAVAERTNEIGTLRAMGQKRSGVRNQFVVEGAIIGAIGALCGTLLAMALDIVVRNAGLEWRPPGTGNRMPLHIDVISQPELVFWTVIVLVAVALVAAVFPARRAARMSIVEALRHS